jgi:hypothetical protein
MCDLKNKFEEWREWLFGEDVHSIQNQILNMIWDAAVFQSINEARLYAPADDNGEPQLNGMVHGFINHCFFQTQALAIRRLLDKETREGARSVCSLYRLLHDLQDNRGLLTRRNILAALDYPYEYEEGLRSLRDAIGRGQPTGDLEKCKFSRSMHEAIDCLAGVSSDKRGRDDKVRSELIDWLIARLESCREIADYVNKFVAHAATPQSRAVVDADELKITLGKLLNAHGIICQTAHCVGLRLFNHSFGNFLVVPQYDQFEHFEKPWVPVSALSKLNDHWQEYYKETMSWKNWDWQAEFEKSA